MRNKSNIDGRITNNFIECNDDVSIVVAQATKETLHVKSITICRHKSMGVHENVHEMIVGINMPGPETTYTNINVCGGTIAFADFDVEVSTFEHRQGMSRVVCGVTSSNQLPNSQKQGVLL